MNSFTRITLSPAKVTKTVFGGGRAVDPVLGLGALRVALADFVVGAAHRRHHHLAVHADNGPTVLDRVLELRRKRVDPIHGGGMFLRKIEEDARDRASDHRGSCPGSAGRSQELGSPRRFRALHRLAEGYLVRYSAADADLEVVAPVEVLLAPSVDLEHDFPGSKLQSRDLDRITLSGGSAVETKGVAQTLQIDRLANRNLKAVLPAGSDCTSFANSPSI